MAGYFDGKSIKGNAVVQYVKTKLFELAWVLWTLLLSPAVPIFAVLNVRSSIIRRLSRFWDSGVLRLLEWIVGLRMEIIGRETLPKTPYILVLNHQSTLETLVLPLIDDSLSVVAKKELEKIPAVGWCLKNYPMLMLDRASGARAGVRLVAEARRIVGANRAIAIFPEGTRKGVRERFVMKKGVYYLYSELGIPIIPVAVNSGVFWGKRSAMIYSGTAKMSILAPIEPGLNIDEFTERVEALINQEKDRLVAELDIDVWIDALG